VGWRRGPFYGIRSVLADGAKLDFRPVLPEPDDIGIAELRVGADAMAVDERAVATPQISQYPVVALAKQHGMACGDVQIRFRIEVDVTLRVAPEKDLGL
jgi:hypothetical protein